MYITVSESMDKQTLNSSELVIEACTGSLRVLKNRGGIADLESVQASLQFQLIQEVSASLLSHSKLRHDHG